MLARAAQALRAAGTAVAQAFGSLSDGIGLEAGRMGRRLGSWIPSRIHVNTLINQSGPNTLARARYLARNNGYAFSAVECFSSNLVGAGIKPSWKSPLPVPDIEEDGADAAAKAASDQKKTVHELWDRWVTEADAEGITNFYGLQKRVARELFIAGEVFVRLRPRYISDGLSIPLQLELLPSEQLPLWLTMPLSNGNWIRQGIEFDWLAAACGFATYEGLGASLQSALSDYRVRAILLDVDSPGGQVDGMLDLADQILAARAKTPVWSVANSVAASAAYALAGSAERLYLPRLAQVGSIGAVMIHIDQSVQDQARGLKYSAVFYGTRKMDGWDHAALSGEARAAFQGRV